MLRISLLSLLFDKGKLISAIAAVAFASTLVFVQAGIYVGFLGTASALIRNIDGDVWIMAKDTAVVDFGHALSSRVKTYAKGLPCIRFARGMVNAENNILVAVDEVHKIYGSKELSTVALVNVSLEINAGQLTLLMGPSGSGKTTLLCIMAGLMHPSSGWVILCKKNISTMRDRDIAQIRRKFVGFVFQHYNLFPELSALDNVVAALCVKGVPAREARKCAQRALVDVGLVDRQHHRPSELSGGQKQRVALARALAGIILHRHINPGDTILPISSDSLAAFEIADITQTQLSIEIEEKDLGEVKPGLPINITPLGRSEVLGKGKILRISGQLEHRKIGADSSRVRASAPILRAWADWQVRKGKPALPIGMRLEVKIQLPPKKVAALVPREAIAFRAGNAWLHLPGMIGASKKSIQLGAVDERNAEVIGVSVGTIVLIAN